MVTVHTETGSVYEFDYENMKMRRVNSTGNFDPLRKDGEWAEMLLWPEMEVGYPMNIALAPLAEGFDVTMRHTSYVTKIDGDD